MSVAQQGRGRVTGPREKPASTLVSGTIQAPGDAGRQVRERVEVLFNSASSVGGIGTAVGA